MKEENQKQKEKAKILLDVGDGIVITEDKFIKKVEVKEKAQKKEGERGQKKGEGAEAFVKECTERSMGSSV